MMMTKIHLIKVLGFYIFLTGVMQGCVWVENTDDLIQHVVEVQTRPSRPIKSLPDFEAYAAFVYEGTMLRNPFIASVQYLPDSDEQDLPVKIDLGNTQPPSAERVKSYLESYAIKSFTMVGNIANSAAGDWALIVDQKGEIHRVAVGDYLGLDHGKVVKVDAEEIKLIETISNGRGGWITRPRNIELIETKNP
jgi:type IV pilus assembly protein PilP